MSYTAADDSLADHVRRQVAGGFHSVEHIVEAGAEIFEVSADAVVPLVEAAIAEHEAAQSAWPVVTDCDRLDAAFRDLEGSGVLARHHWACCNTCGHYEMGDEIYEARGSGTRVDGYVFYHWQDTDRVVDGDPLYLRYAATGSGDAQAVGERVKAALAAHGLATDWSGDPAKTINVPIAWKRRHPPQAVASARPPTWSERLVALLRAEIAGSVETDLLVTCGKVEVALELERRRQGKGLARVAMAMAQVGQPSERIDAVWLEAIAATPYGRVGALALLVEQADSTRAVVRGALRERADQEREDLAGAAVTAWLLVRDPTVAPDARARLVDRVTAMLARDEDHAEAHRAATHAALWVLATRHGGDVDTHRAAVHAAEDDYEVKASYAALLVAVAKLETGETPPQPAPSTLSIADADAAVAQSLVDYDDGLITMDERDAIARALVRSRIHHGDIAGALDDLAAGMRATKNASAIADADVHGWITAVRSGAPPVLPSDESWFTPEGAKKLEATRARWKVELVAHPHRAGIPATKLLAAAAAFAGRGDLETARKLVAEAIPNREDPPRRTHGPLVTALVAMGDLDGALAVVAQYAPWIGARHLAALIVSLGETRADEARAMLDRAVAMVDSRSELVALAPAVVALSPDVAGAAALMLEAWAEAEAAVDAMIAAVAPSAPFTDEFGHHRSS